MENKKMKIGAVVVTYNRLDKLKKALESFEKQLYLPAYVIVADNASTDGTAQYLRQWQKEDAGFKKIILTMESNMGGSGGFYAGIKRAMEQEADWIWVSVEKLTKTGKWISITENIITKKGSVSVKHLFLQKCMRKKSLKWEALLM